MNAAKPYAKAAFRVNQPQDLGITLAHPESLSGHTGEFMYLPANVGGDGKRQALTTIVEVENPSTSIVPCPKSV